jgi:hypothetical protein
MESSEEACYLFVFPDTEGVWVMEDGEGMTSSRRDGPVRGRAMMGRLDPRMSRICGARGWRFPSCWPGRSTGEDSNR